MPTKTEVRLYTTQYGGLTKFIGEWGFVWVKKPENDPRFAKSNFVPHHGLVLTPANDAAKRHEAECKAWEREMQRGIQINSIIRFIGEADTNLARGNLQRLDDTQLLQIHEELTRGSERGVEMLLELGITQ